MSALGALGRQKQLWPRKLAGGAVLQTNIGASYEVIILAGRGWPNRAILNTSHNITFATLVRRQRRSALPKTLAIFEQRGRFISPAGFLLHRLIRPH